MRAQKIPYFKPGIGTHWLRWVAYGIALVVGVMLLSLGVMIYRSYNAGMLDLGNMSQAIWSVTKGRPLEYTHQDGHIPQYSRLSWHAEFIYILLAPLYALFPSPITLLVIQAVFFVAGAIPLYNFAYRRIKHSWAALAIVVMYVFYPVAQTAMLWSFHGDTLAMPLFFFVIDALDRRDWPAYGVWLLLALCCKIYVAIPVVALGAALWLMGQRKSGMYTIFSGMLWGAAVIFLVRPLFAPPDITAAQKTLSDYLAYYFQFNFSSLQESLLDRFIAVGIVFLPIAIYARRSSFWMLPAYAVILPVLLSNGPGPSYSYVYHHYALSVPFLLAGVVYGSEHLVKRGVNVRWRKRQLPSWTLSLIFSLFLTFVANIFASNTLINLDVWFDRQPGGKYEMNYERTSRDQLKDEFLRQHVPDEDAIAISSLLAPHVPNRHILYGSDNILASNAADVGIAIYDALYDKFAMEDNINFLGGALYDWDKINLLLDHPKFTLVDARDGLLLFKRNATERGLRNSVNVTTGVGDVNKYIAKFDDVITLANVSVSHLEARYYELNFTWQASENLQELPLMFAVSRLKGVDNSRFVHLPTLVMQPSVSWKKGSVITEVFDIRVPEDIETGEYTLLTGWYDTTNPFAFTTDERSRIGNEVITAEILVRYP